MTGPIITVTATAHDGQYVRWYRTVHDVELEREAISVWHRGVIVHGYLTAIPEEWVETARQVHATLAANREADVSHIATHRLYQGRVEPIGNRAESPTPG